MKQNLPTFIALVSMLALVTACGDENPATPVVREPTALEKKLIESDNAFGFKLFAEINQTAADENVFISPLSVSMALGMTMNGAEGQTYQEMANTLEFHGFTEQQINQTYHSLIDLLTQLDPKVRFEIANSIWYHDTYTVEQEFKELSQRYFDAEIAGLDFADPSSVDIINSWVKDKTNGKIETILDKISAEAVMFLINAIYFKAPWTIEFDPELTDDDIFQAPAGMKLVPTMHLTTDLRYFGDEHVQVLTIPYGNELFAMTIVLPREHANLDSLASELSPELWQNWRVASEEYEVELALPRFKMAYKVELKKILKALGMEIAFAPGVADFNRLLVERDDAYINEVRHKTFVEVNEEGTEAAAVTSVGVEITSAPKIVSFRVDRPFIFAIHDLVADTILFIGKIVDPGQE